MLIVIDENDNRPIYQQIADEIRLLIAKRELKEDMALPSVRQLAGDLGINLNTVATAYRELQNEGLLSERWKNTMSPATVEILRRARSQPPQTAIYQFAIRTRMFCRP